MASREIVDEVIDQLLYMVPLLADPAEFLGHGKLFGTAVRRPHDCQQNARGKVREPPARHTSYQSQHTMAKNADQL